MTTAKERHPYAYIAEEHDPRTRKRTVPLEVVSAGFSRTGTMTTKTALEILGIPTWHFTEMANLAFLGNKIAHKKTHTVQFVQNSLDAFVPRG